MELSPFTRRQIFGITECLLERADVAGVIPTPLEAVEEAAGVRERIDISDLPTELVAAKPKALSRILGAYLYRSDAYRSDTAFVDLSQASRRVRFIRAHETSHRAIPWHKRSYHLDDEKRLFRETEEQLELEANLAASCLLFQGKRFYERALDYENSVRTPVALAAEFDASIHATIRYYVELHPEPLAVLLVGRYQRFGGILPVLRSLESPSFRRQFGSLTSYVPGGVISLAEEDGPLPWGRLAKAALIAADTPAEHLQLVDHAGESKGFTADAFFNQRCLFVLVSPRSLVHRGRRIRLIAS